MSGQQDNSNNLETTVSSLQQPPFLTTTTAWTVCPTCHGQGQLRRPPSRKARLRHQRAARQQQQQQQQDKSKPIPPPPARCEPCHTCIQSSGLIRPTRATETSASTTITTAPTINTTSDNDKLLLLPRVAIVGGGLAGLALAAACRHRNIPVTVFERDANVQARAAGYGLTMQQAAKALQSLGLILHSSNDSNNNNKPLLPDGITSTKHLVHETNGTVVGSWGMRHWQSQKEQNHDEKEGSSTSCTTPQSQQQQQQQQQQGELSTTATRPEPAKKKKKREQPRRRQNIHIARQALRYHLLQAATAGENQKEELARASGCIINDVDDDCVIHWNHRLIGYQEIHPDGRHQVELTFQVGNSDNKQQITHVADLVVGADGIRSQVRRQLIEEEQTPLRYLDCFVMLGICKVVRSTDAADAADGGYHDANSCPLLDFETVFQTADGTTRIYMMPYSEEEYMWQLSFPMADETAAVELSKAGPHALLAEAIRRCQGWHDPIPGLLAATPANRVSGYPVYDRQLLTREHLNAGKEQQPRRVTLMGDAAHPLSPFKGQGANQALIDALSLARALYQSAMRNADAASKDDDSNMDDNDQMSTIIQTALDEYEPEMMARSSVKVQASAQAAKFLHTPVAIQKGNMTRGAANAVTEKNATSQSLT